MVNVIPKTYKEALDLLNKEDFTVIAGGTDLMVKYKNSGGLPPKFNKSIMLIKHLDYLNYIREDESSIHIGANVTLSNLLESKIVPCLLKESIRNMASPAIRNIGTIGGNIANASPAGDTLPFLYILNAVIVLENYMCKRLISIEEFIKGPGSIDLHDNEIIREIVIKKKDFNYTLFKKIGGRKADSISKVSFIGVLNIENNIVTDFRAAFGAVGPTVIRSKEIENQIVGKKVNKVKRNINRIVKLYENILAPIDDKRSTASYRKKVSLNIIRSFLEKMNQ